MPYPTKGFFKINEGMVQISLMLEVLFTQNFKVEDLFCGAAFGSEPSLGPVVQSIVSLTSSLRGQLVKCFITL